MELLDANEQLVTEPDLQGKVYMRTAYGRADFRPTVLTQKDFVDGKAVVEMLPRGRRTVVIQVQPYGVISEPIQYRR